MQLCWPAWVPVPGLQWTQHVIQLYESSRRWNQIPKQSSYWKSSIRFFAASIRHCGRFTSSHGFHG